MKPVIDTPTRARPVSVPVANSAGRPSPSQAPRVALAEPSAPPSARPGDGRGCVRGETIAVPVSDRPGGPKRHDAYGERLSKNWEVVGTITSNFGDFSRKLGRHPQEARFRAPVFPFGFCEHNFRQPRDVRIVRQHLIYRRLRHREFPYIPDIAHRLCAQRERCQQNLDIEVA
jgi:hypothetical protein